MWNGLPPGVHRAHQENESFGGPIFSPHHEIRMILYLRFDLFPCLAADPPSFVGASISKETILRWLVEVIHREGCRGSGHPGFCRIGRYSQYPFFLIVNGLRNTQSREINATHGRLVEL